ncbi:MAG: aminopeptidase [Phycisphaeraceae bacterium]
MRDSRLDKLADVIVNYSTGVKPGQIVRISGDPIAQPLIEALYERVMQAGAHPTVRMTPDTLQNIFYEHANDEQLKYVSPLMQHEIENIDVSIGIWAETNTKSLTNVSAKKQATASAARKPIFKVFMERAAKGTLKWSGTLYPTAASAQDAEMSLQEYENFVFNAGHLDKADPVAEWMKIKDRQQKLTDYLSNGRRELHFKTDNGTDLKVNVEGMTWINCSGNENFPDGEVFTGPNLKASDGGVNGVVRYSFPAVHRGREVHDIELTFEKGKVVKALASKNQDFLNEMLDQDAGARYLGEIAIGTNYNITRYTKNTLFDEKIGGTFHAAVGAGYPESGNNNESGLHWDMVCDLRTGGTISVDGEVISRDGKFVDPEWPAAE